MLSEITFAISGASGVAYTAAYRGRFDNLLTPLRIVLKPFETGKPVTKSIDTTSHHSLGVGIGITFPAFFKLLDFHLVQISQLDTKA